MKVKENCIYEAPYLPQNQKINEVCVKCGFIYKVKSIYSPISLEPSLCGDCVLSQ